MRRIVTAERAGRSAAERSADYPARRWGNFPIPDRDTRSGRRIAAFVSWGRWIVCCPDCQSAQLAVEEDRDFLCCECGNGGAGWHDVTWPVNYEAIETTLGHRPIPATRNWQPGEPLAQLQEENVSRNIDPGPMDPAAMQRALGLRRAKD